MFREALAELACYGVLHSLESFQHLCRGLVTNFASEEPAEYYASLYKQDDLPGGHIIMLGADDASR